MAKRNTSNSADSTTTDGQIAMFGADAASPIGDQADKTANAGEATAAATEIGEVTGSAKAAVDLAEVPEPVTAAADPAPHATSDPDGSEQPSVAEPGTTLVPYDALTIATDNIWGVDVVDDEHFRRMVAVAAAPANLDPLLVVKSSNGWSVVGDPIALIACGKRYLEANERAALMLPVREIAGGQDTVVLEVARQALGGRPFRNIRRARLALKLREIDGEQAKDIAAKLGVHPSGTTRDLRAARIEREYPPLSAILERPSEAPASYYNDLRDHADQQAAPDKAMAAMIVTAVKLAKASKRFAPTAAKRALGWAMPAKASGKRVELGQVGVARDAICERVAGGALRVVMTLDAPAGNLDADAAAVARWLAAAGTITEPAS